MYTPNRTEKEVIKTNLKNFRSYAKKKIRKNDKGKDKQRQAKRERGKILKRFIYES